MHWNMEHNYSLFQKSELIGETVERHGGYIRSPELGTDLTRIRTT